MQNITDHHQAIHTLQLLVDFITKQEHIQFLLESAQQDETAELEDLLQQNAELDKDYRVLYEKWLLLDENERDYKRVMQEQYTKLVTEQHYNQTLRDENAQLRYKLVQLEQTNKHLLSKNTQLEYQVQALEGELDLHVATIVDLKQQLNTHQTQPNLIFELEGLRETVYQLGCEVGKLQQQAKLNQFLKA